jgi:hypothetical protein
LEILRLIFLGSIAALAMEKERLAIYQLRAGHLLRNCLVCPILFAAAAVLAGRV